MHPNTVATVGYARIVLVEEQPDPTDVVVAQEQRERIGVAVGVGVVVVGCVEPGYVVGRPALSGEVARGALEGKVEDRIEWQTC